MKNSRSPTHSPSFLSDSSPEPSESPDNLSDHQLKQAQDFFDGILNYVFCTNDDIIEIANQIEKNFSTAKSLIETVNNHKILLDGSKNNVPSEILIKEESPLDKSPIPYLDQLDKEPLGNLQAEPAFEDFEERLSANNGSEEDDSIVIEESDDLSISTSTDVGIKTYQDQQTQTSPIIPIQNHFQGPPQYFLYFSLPANIELNQNNESGPQENKEISPPMKQERSESLILVQPVSFIQAQQVQNFLPKGNEINNEIEELEQ